MAEYQDESPQVIAKEITLAVVNFTYRPSDATPENTGEHYGKLYKVILKNVREAIQEKKYD